MVLVTIGQGKRRDMGWSKYGSRMLLFGRRDKRLVGKRERRWLKQQLRKDADE